MTTVNDKIVLALAPFKWQWFVFSQHEPVIFPITHFCHCDSKRRPLWIERILDGFCLVHEGVPRTKGNMARLSTEHFNKQHRFLLHLYFSPLLVKPTRNLWLYTVISFIAKFVHYKDIPEYIKWVIKGAVEFNKQAEMNCSVLRSFSATIEWWLAKLDQSVCR